MDADGQEAHFLTYSPGPQARASAAEAPLLAVHTGSPKGPRKGRR